MKIDDPTNKPALTVATSRSRAGPAARPSARASDRDAANDRVSLSATSRLFSAAPGDAPPFDAARVERLRREIAQGSYQIDAARIADGLLQSVRDLPAGEH